MDPLQLRRTPTLVHLLVRAADGYSLLCGQAFSLPKVLRAGSCERERVQARPSFEENAKYPKAPGGNRELGGPFSLETQENAPENLSKMAVEVCGSRRTILGGFGVDAGKDASETKNKFLSLS